MQLPFVNHRSIEALPGPAIGCSYRWEGGQYCSIQTPRGVVGCGIFDIQVANQFQMAFAIARGTPEHPLREPEDLLTAKIVAVSEPAARLGITLGMTGAEAVAKMMPETTGVDDTRFRPELVHRSVYIAPGAAVLGDVTIGAESSVWFNAVARGDVAPIRIGRQTNIQDGCVLHADPGFPCTIGDRVTLGHAAIVHGATIGDDVMVGMKAVVLNGAQVGSGSLIGVGAVVTEGTVIPPNSVVLGIPGKVKRATEERDRARIRHAAEHYVSAAKKFARSRTVGGGSQP